MALSVVYTTINGRLIQQVKGGQVTKFVSDTLGSVVAEVDDSGQITHTADYWPYGEVRTETGTKKSPFGFVGVFGYMKDFADALYVRARYMKSKLARWQTVDSLWPLELAYSYCSASPADCLDASGTQAINIFPRYLTSPGSSAMAGRTSIGRASRLDCLTRPKPLFMPHEEVSRVNRGIRRRNCKDLANLYHRVCNYKSSELPNVHYGKCHTTDTVTIIDYKTQHWCACCKARIAYHMWCEREDLEHRLDRRKACSNCQDCLQQSAGRGLHGPWPLPISGRGISEVDRTLDNLEVPIRDEMA